MRESVAQWLQLSGFEPVAFEAAEPALKVLGPDFDGVVISDIRMPGMDGMALLRRLQSIDPGLPVILMTGHGDVPMAVEAMRIGAFDFVEKPFEPDRLPSSASAAARPAPRTLETRALRRELSDGSVLMRRLMGVEPGDREAARDHPRRGPGRRARAGPRRDRHRQEPDRDGAARLRPAGGQAARHAELRLGGAGDGRADALRRAGLAGEAADRPGRGRHALPRGHRGAVAGGAGAAPRGDQRQRHHRRRRAAQYPHRRGVEPARPGHAAKRGAARRSLLPARRPHHRGAAAAGARRGHPDALLAFHRAVRRGVRLRAADARRRRRGEPGAGALAGQYPPADQPRRAGGAAGAARRQQHLGAPDRRRLPGAGDADRRREAAEGACRRLREDADRPCAHGATPATSAR